MKKLHHNLKMMRVDAGLSLAKLAEMVGMALHRAIRMENGIHDPEADVIRAIVSACKADPLEPIRNMTVSAIANNKSLAEYASQADEDWRRNAPLWKRGKAITPEQDVLEIQELRRTGMKYQDIADVMEVSLATAYRYGRNA